MPDYVLEGSKGTPFEGKDHTYYIIYYIQYLFCYL